MKLRYKIMFIDFLVDPMLEVARNTIKMTQKGFKYAQLAENGYDEDILVFSNKPLTKAKAVAIADKELQSYVEGVV